MIKKILRVNLFLLIIMGQMVFAQDRVMIVHKNDGSVVREPVTEIDSVTFQEVGTVTDIDNNTYKTVKIGDQWWMAENLKTTKYNDETSIPNVTDAATWSNLLTDAYCAYNNDVSNESETYGYLYNWYAVDTGKLAPSGWHVPTDVEWEKLAQYISDQNGPYSKSDDDWNDVGTHLKSTSGWNSDGNGTDDYGFTGLPAGYRITTGIYHLMGYNAYFWSATEYNYNSNYAWGRGLFYTYTKFNRDYNNKGYGFSVRCVRD